MKENYDSHYNSMDIQPIEFMQLTLTNEEFIGFLKGNAIKYIMRAGKKAGEPEDKDKAKAMRYIEWLQQAKEGKTINPRE